jgi:CBS domain-containing protein
MENKVIMLDGNLSAKKALDAMLKNGVWSVVVSDKGLPCGVVTERDLLRRAVAKDRDLDKLQLRDVMSSPLITIDSDAPFGKAWELMVEKSVRRLYVIENGKIIGRVTQTGLFQKLLDALLTLSSVRYLI